MKEGYISVAHETPWQSEENGLTVTRGSAWSGPGCHLGCAVLMYTDKDGKLVKVEGDPDNPFNQGRLCVRCLDVASVTNHPDRLTHPMKRAREDRGKDKWEQITWEEAFDTIEERFKAIRDEYGAECIVFNQGTGRDIAPYITRLAWSFGSPSYCGMMSGFACYAPRVAGMIATTGAFWVADCAQQFPLRYDDPRYTVPKVMFLWGNYPLKSNSDGFYGHWVIDLMKRGMKIVCVDPKLTWLGARAEIHLPVRPGTDVALALAMLQIIIAEDLYDYEFVDLWCYGFDEFSERVMSYDLDMLIETTWVPVERVFQAARLLAASKPATLQWGVAVDMTKEAVPASQAIMSLFQITGNVDIPGGVIAPVEILNYAGGWGYDLMSDEAKAKRIGLDKYKLLQFGFLSSQPDSTLFSLEDDSPIHFRAAWVQTTNPIACMGADPERLLAAYSKLDFIVCVDIFKTPMIMALADIVLPAQTFPERDGVRVGDGIQRAEAINKVCQVGDTKSDMEINLEMGKRLSPDAWPWDNVQEMYDAILADSGIKFAELKENSPLYLPFEYERYKKGLFRPDGKPGFNTSTGRIELFANFFVAAELDPMPYFEEPSPGPVATPEMLEEYPLVLTTGARRWSLFHSEHRQIPRLRALAPYPILEVHPKAAERYGVTEGEWVWIENFMGRVKRRVVLTPTLPERIVACDHGWWLPEGDPEDLYGYKDLAVGNLIPWVNGRSGFGSNYKTTLVKIYSCREGE